MARERVDEPKPLLPVIVSIAVEMLRDPDLEPSPQRDRKERVKQDGTGADEKQNLQKRTPAALPRPDHEAADAHREQIESRAHDARRVERDLPRDDELRLDLR